MTSPRHKVCGEPHIPLPLANRRTTTTTTEGDAENLARNKEVKWHVVICLLALILMSMLSFQGRLLSSAGRSYNITSREESDRTVHASTPPPASRRGFEFKGETPQEECGPGPEPSDPFPMNFYSKRDRKRVRKPISNEIRGAVIHNIVNQLTLPSLEMGPYVKPTMVGPNVKYFDVLDREGLLARANKTNYPVRRVVEIDFVNPTGDLRSIKQPSQFSMILSSHCIEHQLDLVRHFHQVSRLLVDGGYYVLLVSQPTRKTGAVCSLINPFFSHNICSFITHCCRSPTAAIVLIITSRHQRLLTFWTTTTIIATLPTITNSNP